jgi:hypothetical protein
MKEFFPWSRVLLITSLLAVFSFSSGWVVRLWAQNTPDGVPECQKLSLPPYRVDCVPNAIKMEPSVADSIKQLFRPESAAFEGKEILASRTPERLVLTISGTNHNEFTGMPTMRSYFVVIFLPSDEDGVYAGYECYFKRDAHLLGLYYGKLYAQWCETTPYYLIHKEHLHTDCKS